MDKGATKAKGHVGFSTTTTTITAAATTPASQKEYRSDETVEQFIMRVCEEQVAQLHRKGEEQIELFIAEARIMKASATANS